MPGRGCVTKIYLLSLGTRSLWHLCPGEKAQPLRVVPLCQFHASVPSPARCCMQQLSLICPQQLAWHTRTLSRASLLPGDCGHTILSREDSSDGSSLAEVAQEHGNSWS